jgi:glycosyltransferase involved in cell wall biosynthesis
MRVVVDLQVFPLSTALGSVIDDYSAALVSAMLRYPGLHDVTVMISHSSEELLEELRKKLPDLFSDHAVCVSRLPFLEIAQATGHWHRTAAELVREHALLQLKPDVILCAPLAVAAGPLLVSQLRCSAIPAAIALSHVPGAINPKTTAVESDGNALGSPCNGVQPKQSWQSELVLTASDYSKRRLVAALELVPDRVLVVPPGVAERLRPATASLAETHAISRRFTMSQDFILSIAGGTHHEVQRLVEAYVLMPAEVRAANRLVIVGVVDNNVTRELLGFAHSNGLSDGQLAIAPGASDDELAALYSTCKLVVLSGTEDATPQEALRAMSYGMPLLGPNHTSLREIFGLSEAMFDPGSARSLSETLCRALMIGEFREKLKLHSAQQARRFTWEASAHRSFEALEKLHRPRPATPSTRPSSPHPRSRMAYVSPLPPERSGIADYSAELLPELAKHYQIDLITDLPQIAEPFLQQRFKRVSFQEFEKTARTYERILYHVGNSPFHSQIPSLVEQYPGVVVFHDFFLSHLFKYLESIDDVSLWRNLYISHGYPSLLARARRGDDAAVWEYPCSLAVLSAAAGVIVHSEHARQLASEWFGISPESCRVIPQLRRPQPPVNREKARKILAIASDAFVVCSFGFLSPAKLNHLLHRSWLGTSLARLPNCHLVFAGGDGAGNPYQLNELPSSRIRATGYLSREEYELYLAAADVGVQLRSELSRGETPRSVLDCMAYGLATVVSSHPALADLPKDSVLKLSPSTNLDELVAALEKLYRAPKYRAELGQRARHYVETLRSPVLIARQYADVVEEFAREHPVALTNRITINLVEQAVKAAPSDSELATLASCIAEHRGRDGLRQLLVDITVLVSLGDSKTGIHRTTRAILRELLENPPAGWRIEPVLRRHGETYRYARRFVEGYLGLRNLNLEDAPVAVNPRDVFLGLDWDPGISVDDQAANWLLHHRQRGLRTVFTIYDLLPIEHSEWFKPDMQPVFHGWLSRICRIAEGFACISRTVADELISWLDGYSPAATRAIDVGYFHLGSDIEASCASHGLSHEEQSLLNTLKGREVLLMVGTVEPRKGHGQALPAMEQLWLAGENATLVICGRQGWMVDSLAEKLRSHPELGRRLFWMEQATDEALLKLYSIASSILMASEGEGFGLPLVEAAHYGVPIITRDLAVFREVAGEHAYYFSGTDSTHLAAAIRNWLELYRRGEHPKSNVMPRLTWQQSTEQLLRIALGGPGYRRWRRARAFELQRPVQTPVDGRATRGQADQGASMESWFANGSADAQREEGNAGIPASPLNIENRTN